MLEIRKTQGGSNLSVRSSDEFIIASKEVWKKKQLQIKDLERELDMLQGQIDLLKEQLNEYQCREQKLNRALGAFKQNALYAHKAGMIRGFFLGGGVFKTQKGDLVYDQFEDFVTACEEWLLDDLDDIKCDYNLLDKSTRDYLDSIENSVLE